MIYKEKFLSRSCKVLIWKSQQFWALSWPLAYQTSLCHRNAFVHVYFLLDCTIPDFSTLWENVPFSISDLNRTINWEWYHSVSRTYNNEIGAQVLSGPFLTIKSVCEGPTLLLGARFQNPKLHSEECPRRETPLPRRRSRCCKSELIFRPPSSWRHLRPILISSREVNSAHNNRAVAEDLE